MLPHSEGQNGFEHQFKMLLREYDSSGTVNGIKVRDKKQAVQLARRIARKREGEQGK